MGIRARVDNGIGTIGLARPERLNALDDATLLEIWACLDEWEWDDGVGVVLLRGGPRAFSSGSDIKEMAGYGPTQLARHQALGQRLCDRLSTLAKPVVASIRGYCLGGGFELALAADLRLAGHSALFGLPEVQLGAIPSWGGTQRLPLVVGLGRALELVLEGKRLDADTARAWGLVTDIVSDDEIDARARTLCSELRDRAPATGVLKLLIRQGALSVSPAGRVLESLADVISAASPEFEHAVSAYARGAGQPDR